MTLLQRMGRGLQAVGGSLLLVVGVWLFAGDVLVLLHRRPLPGDGFFGIMVGPILAVAGAFVLWQALAAFGLVKPVSIKPR